MSCISASSPTLLASSLMFNCMSQVVTCSGYGGNGSLRVVRSGVGINELATIDLAGVKGLWSLHCGPGITEADNSLIIAFVGQTTYV